MSESPGGLVKIQSAECDPYVSNSGGLGWSSGIYIFNKFPGNADVADPGTIL